MLNDQVKVSGELRIVLRDANGNIKTEVKVPNLVVNVGKNAITSRLAGNAVAVMSHMAVGTAGAAPTSVNTALGAEIASGRVALTSTVLANNVITYAATFPGGVGSGPIVEAGVFNNSIGGVMLCRTSFSVVNKDIVDSLTISWAIMIA